MSKFAPTRERKHRRIAKQKAQSGASASQTAADSAGAEEIPLVSRSEKEEHRAKLRADLRLQQPESKASAKKRKRLDKYIDTKLRKEENLELLKKLAAHKVDTSLLQSAKKLGRRTETKRERFSRALAEKNAGIDVDGQQQSILYEKRRSISDEPLGESEAGEEKAQALSATAAQQRAESAPQPRGLFGSGAVFGGGLKRPLETDDAGQPVIKRRRRERKNKKAKFACVEALPPGEGRSSVDASDEWKGFSGNESEGLESDSGRTSGDAENESASVDDSDATASDAGSVETDEDEQGAGEDKPARVSAFKAWADSRRNEAVGFTPSAVPTSDAAIKAAFKPRAPSPNTHPSELTSDAQTAEEAYRPSKAVVIPRNDAIAEARSRLPIVQDEQKIVEAINNNSVTIVCGATGSGKTTQLPQMLLENGYASTGLIGVTQPRRVAATSVAKRVQYELGPDFGKQVGAQVRFTSTLSRDTKVKFMTDGILLREISQDFALSKYSAIVLDEAHERSVNTDVLIGMLSRIVPLRLELSKEDSAKHHPLKLIIMSATLRVTDFLMNERLFRKSKPPVLQADGRQYPVTEHFARRTQRDYVAEMVRKVGRGHKKLPPGDILVFLTGQDDIQTVAKRLRETFTGEQAGFQPWNRIRPEKPVNDDMEEDEDATDDEAEITGLDDEDDAEFTVELDPSLHGQQQRPSLKAQILPLYAALPASQQDLVFQKTPDGARKIILATNIAETSLTIDGVRYVFDCGRSKEKVYDVRTGVQEFKVDWISKASASQRMGRAGRTGPGHCYRLYSSAIYEAHFEEHSLPEILRTPIEGTVLQLKNMSVDNVVNFPYPTPPASEQLSQAERLLKNLGAIDSRSGKVTEIGKQLIQYPVNPRFGRMLLLGKQNSVLKYTIALVAGLAVGDLFIAQPQLPKAELEGEDSGDDRVRKISISVAETETEKRRQAYGRAHANLASQDDKSDAIKILTAVAAHAQAESQSTAPSFCSEHFLREKAMAEVQQLRKQLHDIMQRHADDPSIAAFSQTLPPPSDREKSLLKQIVAAGYIDQVAIRHDLLPNAVSAGRKPRRAIELPYNTLIPSKMDNEIDRDATSEDLVLQKSVFVHASSVLARLSLSEMPPFVVYSTLSRATSSHVGEAQKRTRMHPLCTVSQKQLALLAEGSPLLEIGKPIGKIEELGTGRRQCWVGVALRDPDAVGTTGWPLGAWKVIQSRKGKTWSIEKVLDRGT